MKVWIAEYYCGESVCEAEHLIGVYESAELALAGVDYANGLSIEKGGWPLYNTNVEEIELNDMIAEI